MCQNLPKHKLHNCLGSALSFYNCSDEEMLMIRSICQHLLILPLIFIRSALTQAN